MYHHPGENSAYNSSLSCIDESCRNNAWAIGEHHIVGGLLDYFDQIIVIDMQCLSWKKLYRDRCVLTELSVYHNRPILWAIFNWTIIWKKSTAGKHAFINHWPWCLSICRRSCGLFNSFYLELELSRRHSRSRSRCWTLRTNVPPYKSWSFSTSTWSTDISLVRN